MVNNFKYSFNEKRYHTFNYYLKTKYNHKVSKVILDAGFTCPNRDGSKGYGGCIFCSALGSGDSNIALDKDIYTQYLENKKVMDHKWPNSLYIPYFQAFSNTYGPLEKIEKMLKPFIHLDEVAEIAIATRCDCLSDEIIKMISNANPPKTTWPLLASGSDEEIKKALSALSSSSSLMNESVSEFIYQQMIEVAGETPEQQIAQLTGGELFYLAGKAKNFSVNEKNLKYLNSFAGQKKSGRVLSEKQITVLISILKDLADNNVIQRNSIDGDKELCDKVLDALDR